MQKTADPQKSKIDPSIVGRFALGGLVSGGATMALVNLVRMLKHMNNYRKDVSRSPETDENTIVLNLPPKAAEISGATALSSVGKTTGPVSKTTASTYTPKNQFRNSGSFGSSLSKSAANWQTLTAATLATMGSAITGVTVMNKLYQWKREKILKDKVEAAKQEYLGMLSDSSDKLASSLDVMFSSANLEKEAAGSAFGMLNYPMAMAALVGILGAGGTGYIVKTMLDSKAKEYEEKGLDIPKVKRIIFKSRAHRNHPDDKSEEGTTTTSKGVMQPQDPTIDKVSEVVLTANEVDSIKAALAVYIDYMDTTTRIMNEPELKQAMANLGVTERSMLKMAQDFNPEAYTALMDFFNKDPKGQQLQQLFIRAAMAKHPTLKHFQWASNLPGIRGMAQNKFNSKLTEAVGPVSPLTSMKQDKASLQPKRAAFAPGSLQADITGSLIGTTLANQNSSKEIAQEILQAQDDAAKERAARKTPEETAEDIQLDAVGPEAKEYLAHNKARVRALLKRLVIQGKI